MVTYVVSGMVVFPSHFHTFHPSSVGALAFDIMTGAPPFMHNNRKKTIELILNKKLVLPHYLSPDAKDLLTRV